MSFLEILEKMGIYFIKYWKVFLLKGVGYTLVLSLITICAGAVIGALFALTKISKLKPLSGIVGAIVEVVRGTPLLLQLYVGYFLVPMLLPFLELSAFTCIAVALSLNSAAYVSEVIRSGIEAVDKGQSEAARSLGLNAKTTMINIVLPQAVKNILPTLGNEFITLIKETSIVSFVGALDLYVAFRKIGTNTYEFMVPYIVMALIYIALVLVISGLIKLMERSLSKSDRSR